MSSPTVLTLAKPILPKHGKITLKDATGTPIVFEVPFTEAVDLGVIKRAGENIKAFRNRGKTVALAATGFLESRTVSFKVKPQMFTHATNGVIIDWVRGEGAYGALVSTLPDDNGGDEVFTCKAKLTLTRTDFGTPPSWEGNYCTVEVSGIAEGGSEEEEMMATVTITNYHIGDSEADWETWT